MNTCGNRNVRGGFTFSLLAIALSAIPGSAQAAGEQILACGGRLENGKLIVARVESLCEWPFEVESMEIGCDAWGPRSGELYFSSEHGKFGLNGSGKTRFGDPRPIWLDAQDWAGGKVSVQPWIDAALDLCQ